MVIEGVAQGGFGNAKGFLITLHRAIYDFFLDNGWDSSVLFDIAPTSAKSFARTLLPIEEQFEGLLKSGKPQKVKMMKSHMIKACELSAPEGWLEGINLSQGKADYADSYLIGLKWVTDVYPTLK